MQGPVELVGIVGAPTYRRGLDYAEKGYCHLERLEEADKAAPAPFPGQRDRRVTTWAKGVCRGSGDNVYTVEADYRVSRTGVVLSMSGLCSCPVGLDCKHAVALVMMALWSDGEAKAPELSGWQTGVGTIFDDPLAETPLALAIAFTAPRAAIQPTAMKGQQDLGSTGSLLVRPLRKGRRSAWVSNDVGWNRFQTHAIRNADPAQVEALDRLRQLYVAAVPFDHAPQWLRLNVIDNPSLWTALRNAVAAGVQIVESETYAPVRLETEPAHARIVIGAVVDSYVQVRALLEHENMPDSERAVRIGRPMHGIAWKADDGIHLAPLEGPASTPWLRLHMMPDGLRVPADEREMFEAELLPLMSKIGWTAHSVAPARAVAAELHVGVGVVAQVKAGVPPRAVLHWSWGADTATLSNLMALDESGPGVDALASNLSAELEAELRPMLDAIAVDRKMAREQRKRARTHVQPLSVASFDPRRDSESEAKLLAQVCAILHPLPTTMTEVDGQPIPLQDCVISGLDVVTLADEVIPQLEAAGVKVDHLGEIPDFKLRAAPTISLDAQPLESAQRDWLDLSLTMQVGEVAVPMPALLEALTRKDPAIFLPSGEYVRLDTPELDHLRELLDEARALGDRRRSGIRVPRVRQSWWEELLSLDVVEESTNAWFASIRQAVATPPAPAPRPRGLTAQLRPYQLQGFQWMAQLRRSGLGGVLADDMGLGKTVQTLAMIQDEREELAAHRGKGEPKSGPWIVVAPTSVVSNWAAEARKFTPGLRVAIVESTGKRRGQALEDVASGVDILITSYTLLRLEADHYAALNPAGLILDEAQQAKNPNSKTFTALMSMGSPVVFAITGTPMENNLGELWAVFALTAPGLLGSMKQFGVSVRRPIERGEDTQGEVMALLRRRIAPFLLRRTKSDVAADLPEKQEQILKVELAPAHRRAYDRNLQRERQRVLHLAEDMDHNRVEVLSILTRLRQLAIDPALVDADSEAPSSKLDALIYLLNEVVTEGHRTLVFSQFTRYLQIVARRLEAEGIAYAYLDGSTTKRADVIEEFAQGDAPVFLISLKAGGVGLNLTMADYVVLTDPWWNPAAEEQAVDRTHRIGQTKSVHVYRMVSQDTIEEKVLALQDAKRQLVAEVLAADDSALVSESSDNSSGSKPARAVGGAKLTAEDLRMLLG